jgi:hypothetical protein
LLITDAIETAQTAHVVYFLLTAYVETLGYYDPLRSTLPPCVRRLPVAGIRDVTRRLRALRETPVSNPRNGADVRALLDEAVALFDTARRRLRTLHVAQLTIVRRR